MKTTSREQHEHEHMKNKQGTERLVGASSLSHGERGKVEMGRVCVLQRGGREKQVGFGRSGMPAVAPSIHRPRRRKTKTRGAFNWRRRETIRQSTVASISSPGGKGGRGEGESTAAEWRQPGMREVFWRAVGVSSISRSAWKKGAPVTSRTVLGCEWIVEGRRPSADERERRGRHNLE